MIILSTFFILLHSKYFFLSIFCLMFCSLRLFLCYSFFSCSFYFSFFFYFLLPFFLYSSFPIFPMFVVIFSFSFYLLLLCFIFSYHYFVFFFFWTFRFHNFSFLLLFLFLVSYFPRDLWLLDFPSFSRCSYSLSCSLSLFHSFSFTIPPFSVPNRVTCFIPSNFFFFVICYFCSDPLFHFPFFYFTFIFLPFFSFHISLYNFS